MEWRLNVITSTDVNCTMWCYKDEVADYKSILEWRGLEFKCNLKTIVALPNYQDGCPEVIVTGATFDFEEFAPQITIDFYRHDYGYCMRCGFRSKTIDSRCGNCESYDVYVEEQRHFMLDSSLGHPIMIASNPATIGSRDQEWQCASSDALIAVRDWMIAAGASADYVRSRCVISCPNSQIFLQEDDHIEVVLHLRSKKSKKKRGFRKYEFKIPLVDSGLLDKLRSLVDGTFRKQFIV